MPEHTLVYGFGNIGRQDDGLGVLLAGELAALAPAGVAVDTNYQLNVEDALAIAPYRRVFFLDASLVLEGACALTTLAPANRIAFSTHAMTPAAVLAFADQLYGARPDAWLLQIRGYAWEFGAAPTPRALGNLALARDLLLQGLDAPEQRASGRPSAATAGWRETRNCTKFN